MPSSRATFAADKGRAVAFGLSETARRTTLFPCGDDAAVPAPDKIDLSKTYPTQFVDGAKAQLD
jgi:hypothetical protein